MTNNEVFELQKLFFQTHDYADAEFKNRVLVLGIGNFIMGDEGIGVHSIQALSKVKLPDFADLVDGGTGSFNLMPILAKYPITILIDATMDGKPEGTLSVLYPKYSSDFPSALTAHDIGLKDMVDALEFNGELPKIVLITVTIKDILPMTTDLSPKVKNAIPSIIEKVTEVLGTLKL